MPAIILSPARWARRQFGSVDLGDQRRDRRVVAMAARLVGNPNASLPNQMGSPKALKAAYRVLGEEEATSLSLWRPACSPAATFSFAPLRTDGWKRAALRTCLKATSYFYNPIMVMPNVA